MVKTTAGGCATESDPGTLRVEKIEGPALRFTWGPTSTDDCFEAWRVHGATDPSSWAEFEPNLLAETASAGWAGDPDLRFFLVTAIGTDGRTAQASLSDGPTR